MNGTTSSGAVEAKVWHYQAGGQAVGPVDEPEIAKLIVAGPLTPATLVWKKGMPTWVPAGQTELKRLFPADVPPPLASADIPPPIAPAMPATGAAFPIFGTATSPEQLNLLYMIFWISLTVGAIITNTIGATLILLLGVLALLVGLGLYIVLLYKFWSLVPAKYAKGSPGLMAGLSAIPFFACYWMFPAFWELGKAMNAEAKARGIMGKVISEELCLAASIAVCCSYVGGFITPQLGTLCQLACYTLLILCVGQIKDRAIAFLPAR